MRAESLCAERRSPRHARPAFFGALLAGLLFPRFCDASAITHTEGKVLFLKFGSYTWGQVVRGQVVGPGDRIKTAASARATVTFDDDSRVELSPSTSFTMREASERATETRLDLGSLRAWIAKRRSRSFQVRTPTAVAAVRGTEFSVDVSAQGETRVQMFGGLLAVSDNRGNEVLIKDNQRVEVTAEGIGRVTEAPQGADQRGSRSARETARREVGLEMTKEEVQAAAALEQKNAVYQEGKALIDVNGKRVRVEEYIVRPAADQFKLVVLNERSDRFDYFFYHGTFNRALPDDMSTALRQVSGCIGAACDYFLLSYDTGRSNTIDKVVEAASGGHQVDVNHNGVAGDAVTAAFDPATDRWVSLTADQPFYQTLFNDYSIKFNDVTHQSWTASGLAPGGDIQNTTTHVTYTDVTTVQYEPSCAPPNCTYTEEGVLHQVVYAENAGGTIWEKYDNYIISDEGKIAKLSDFAGITSGAAYKTTLLNWNYQQIVTASEFGGRKIDLVVEPKIFIKSGLIP
ncbi:MAG: hypothetical protein A2V88_00600 [Elusimicrobia bacterium RBG_16_66_12]|nr:MAG: hypothetical protein A2V88_00600 [Elusimicrobia bacterium RBG_16_66_12]